MLLLNEKETLILHDGMIGRTQGRFFGTMLVELLQQYELYDSAIVVIDFVYRNLKGIINENIGVE